MIEVKIPKKIKIGGFTYTVKLDKATALEMKKQNLYGQCVGTAREIRLDTDQSAEQISATFIHEVIHAVDDVYTNSSLTEMENKGLANGLYQVIEQLGIRFVKEK